MVAGRRVLDLDQVAVSQAAQVVGGLLHRRFLFVGDVLAAVVLARNAQARRCV